tara:strand:- start:458 stop:1066 length:609 start_codon:yes stop_codon:yes gene_type:complete
MNRETFIDKLKTMFSQVEETVVEDKFVDVTTIDGIVLRVKEEEIVEGVQVFVVGEDNSETPAPEGEHTIEGKVIITDAEGKVVEVKEIEVPVEETEEEIEAKRLEAEKVAEELEASKLAEQEQEAEKLKASSELETRIASLENTIANLSESMSAIDGLSKVVAEIAGLPADKEIKLSKADSEGSNLKTNSREDKLKTFSKRG